MGSNLGDMAARRIRRRARRARRAVGARRWLAVAALGFVAVLYYRPLASFVEVRAEVAERSAEVRRLEAEKRELERRLVAQTSTDALVREARRLAYVKPGERLFIVKGIPEWRRAHDPNGSTIAGDGG